MNMAVTPDFKGRLLHNEPMSRHCSWRAGGSADVYYEPLDLADLQVFMQSLSPGTPVTWLGLGSNLLVRDGGLRGVVISVLNRLKGLEQMDDGRVYAECGVTNASLARFSQKQGLADADFLAGIPGTVGGALAMNAGAFGFETWQFVESVNMLNRKGELIKRKRDEFNVSYRTVNKQDDEWFVAASFSFPEMADQQGSNIKALLEKRNASQPIGKPSCGSVFKNPEGDYSARLIEACGLKGYCIGGACVSEKHANFIINSGGASANDIESLIHEIQRQVEQKFSIHLQPEVRIIGDHA